MRCDSLRLGPLHFFAWLRGYKGFASDFCFSLGWCGADAANVGFAADGKISSLPPVMPGAGSNVLANNIPVRRQAQMARTGAPQIVWQMSV